MKKTIEAMVQKNLQLSAEFSRYLFEHPEIIPAKAGIQKSCSERDWIPGQARNDGF